MSKPNSVAQFIDASEKNGVLNLNTLDIENALSPVSPDAIRQALHRLQKKGRITSVQRGTGHWLIIPLRDAHTGAPPLEAWLHSLMAKTLRVPYYVGLLSAAEIYGASPYAVMKTQIFVAKARRELTVGRHQLAFFSRQNVKDIPTQWHETVEGRYLVSTPEITALELLQRQQFAGGSSRVVAVLEPLFEACSTSGMQRALDAIQDVAATQRLGAILKIKQQTDLANVAHHWLLNKRTRPMPLTAGQNSPIEVYDETFKVYLPLHQDANA